MRIIPAIDIIDGRCVRLTKGDYNTKKIYNESPLEVAKEFERQSSKKIDIIKLPRRKGDLGKIIASNDRLNKFIKWKPKYNKLDLIVKSCLNWEKNQ